MNKQIFKILSGICLGLMVSGCAIYNSEYYIPVDTQIKDAKSLSKDDVIRVVIPHSFPVYYINAHRDDDSKNGWKWTDLAMYNIEAKHETEKRLQNLGFNVINTGYHSRGDGHPTVIALVDSAPIEGSETTETHTWDTPVFTDDMGRTTLSEKQGITITHKTYYYKAKLVRPEGKYNSLFECNSSIESLDYCIAPENPKNYKTIFSSYATISTNNMVSGINVAHLTIAIFYNYPNMIGKKWVYFTNTGYTPIYVTDPNSPKPTNKK